MRNISQVNSPDKSRKVSVVIPAAGMGKRMKGRGPKCLIEIKEGLNVIDNQIKIINSLFYRPEIIVVSGFESEKVKEHLKRKRVKVVWNKDWLFTNVVASINVGLKEISHNNLLVVYGDLVFNKKSLTAPFGSYSAIISDVSGGMKKEEVGFVSHQNRLVRMMYDLPNKWAQIAYFTGDDLALFKRLCAEKSNKNCYGFEIINEMIERGSSISSISPKGMKITDIDYPKDIKAMRDMF